MAPSAVSASPSSNALRLNNLQQRKEDDAMRKLWAKDEVQLGSATCPDCKRLLRYGPGGLINLEITHLGKAVCRELKEKNAKAARDKPSTMLNYFSKKINAVPSTVQAPALINSSSISTRVAKSPATVTAKTSAAPIHIVPSPISNPSSGRLIELIHQLRTGARKLPLAIPDADETNPLAAFSGDPASYVGADVEAEELWERLSSIFHGAFDYGGSPESRERMIQPGPQGIGGFCRFLEYFVQRGLQGAMVELKAEQVLEALDSVLQKHSVPTSKAVKICDAPTIVVIDSDSETESAGISVPTIPPPPPEIPLQCAGYIFPFNSEYPFGLHSTLSIPWSYSYNHGIITLRSHGCHGKPVIGQSSCIPCTKLDREPTLEGILDRAEHGIPENANYAYYSFSGLTELIRRKNQRIQELRLQGLNTARKILVHAKSLSDYKRLVRAIGSGVAQNVDRLVRVALRQKRGIRAILRLHDDAARGVYHPKDYTEQDDLRGVLIWKMGGNRLADLAHRSLGLPSRTTLRSRLTVPPITPSPGIPQVSEVAQNIEACFAGITDVLATKKVVHQILMFDELATEKRVRWHDKTNTFIGVCRQHGSKISLQFDSQDDLDELFRALETTESRDAVHYAGEATVAAVGILSDDTRLYAARPVLVSGDCKKETGDEHARNVIRPTIQGVDSKKDLTRLRIVSVASDGESRRGAAFIDMTFVRKLSPESNIYNLLKDLKLMNFWVGDDDLTPDKDPKHVFKRLRNRLLRKSGTEVMGVQISSAIIRMHLQSASLSTQHINSLFNPDDKQDVKLAFDLLKDIWSLPLATESTRPGFISARTGLHTLGTLFYHLLFPYICVDLTLSEQLQHLSAAAHLALILYRDGGNKALPTLLYTDIMIIVKNAYFCVAKAKVDDPEGNFWLILLGTDRLEQLFGILRTMIGNDANLDILQLIERITGTTECANILAKYPHWDRPPRRLTLPALARDSTELPDKVDHIRPPSWRADTAVRNVTPLTCWRRGRRTLEEELPHLSSAFQALDAEAESNPEIDILSPNGTLITKVSLSADDNEDEDELGAEGEKTTVTTPLSADLEDAVMEEEERHITPDKPTPRHKASSKDRLRRVADVERYSSAENADIAEFDSAFGAPSILVSEPIVTLVRSEDKLFVCIGEVTDIHVDSQSVEQLALEVFQEKPVTVSFQILRVVPATAEDDPTLKNDWVSGSRIRTVLSSPGRLVLPIDPTISTRIAGKPCYLFESSVLRAFGAQLMDLVTLHVNKTIPKFNPTEGFPYRESHGRACFVCEGNDDDDPNLFSSDPHVCGFCTPSFPLDTGHPQSIIAHIGAHILHDPTIDRSTEPRGLCGRPSPMSSSGCPNLTKRFSVGAASKSIANSPCSNAPLKCPGCSKKDPAVWRYNTKFHLMRHHPEVSLPKYAHLWELGTSELAGMKMIWNKRTERKTVKKSKSTLTISAAHSSRLALVDENLPKSADVDSESSESDEASTTRSRRKRTLRPVDLSQCLCGESAVPSDGGSTSSLAQCKDTDMPRSPEQLTQVQKAQELAKTVDPERLKKIMREAIRRCSPSVNVPTANKLAESAMENTDRTTVNFTSEGHDCQETDNPVEEKLSQDAPASGAD
ncbi:hypothetical protein B0H13DRAFT_2552011 [Mycena leptocephala]|nr:hypothetical protein B0H13DRAFT_2552011 [Mycena leptocephala]